MYLTAHRVEDAAGRQGINAYCHRHGPEFPWPVDAWRLPQDNPGEQQDSREELPPGGNRVCSFLDVLAPDGTDVGQLRSALESLWLELVAAESVDGVTDPTLPNPLGFRKGDISLRFGVDSSLMSMRALELTALDEVLAPWLQATP